MIGYYGSTLLSMLRAIRHMPGALRKHAVQRTDYAAVSKALRNTVGVHDVALNLFLRATLAHGYRTVIEIGAYDGARITTLKRLAPSIEAFGLDILANYATPFEAEGVRFRRFEHAFFETVSAPALVCARGTLAYIPPAELDAFLRLLAARGIDLALYEPAPYRNVAEPLRRSRDSYYHSYDRILRQSGLVPVEDFNSATRETFSLSMMEPWYLMLARATRAG